MLRIRLFFVGKEKAGWVQDGVSEYERRLKGKISLDWHPLANDGQLLTALEKEGRVVGLDPSGKLMSSESFSAFLYRELEEGGSRLTFVIGGPNGLPAGVSFPLISLSPLTFTHELARVVLAEQIYRAAEIRSGSPYHK